MTIYSKRRFLMGYRLNNDYDEKIIEACSSHQTMAQACASLGLHFSTFKRHAERLGVYEPNQAGKGISKPKKEGVDKYPLKDILDGKYPYYGTWKLKNRLIKAGIKTLVCEVCGVSEWQGKQLSMELNHKDGDRHNHKLDNLQIVCPNCHSILPHYRGRNINGRKLNADVA